MRPLCRFTCPGAHGWGDLQRRAGGPGGNVAAGLGEVLRVLSFAGSLKVLPRDLSVVEQVIDPQPGQATPQAWRCIGQEVSEQLDYEPGRFLRRRIIRRKYVHRTDCDLAPIIAPLPESLRERGLAASGLLAHLLVSKYCDHLPLYRHEQIFARRHGVHLPRQTLARWVELAADWLKPIYEPSARACWGAATSLRPDR